jgi:hypothetical protein
MANGKFGSAMPAANTLTSIGTALLNGTVLTIMAVNDGPTDAVIEAWITLNASAPAAADRVEAPIIISANGGFYERSGIVLSKDEQVVVRASTANVVWRAHGFDS